MMRSTEVSPVAASSAWARAGTFFVLLVAVVWSIAPMAAYAPAGRVVPIHAYDRGITAKKGIEY